MPWLFKNFAFLGLGQFNCSVAILLISYPFTNALPAETWYRPRESLAGDPVSVSSPIL